MLYNVHESNLVLLGEIIASESGGGADNTFDRAGNQIIPIFIGQSMFRVKYLSVPEKMSDRTFDILCMNSFNQKDLAALR